MNYGWRFMTLYRRQESRPSTRKRNAKKQNGCLRRETLQIAVKIRDQIRSDQSLSRVRLFETPLIAAREKQRRKGKIYPFECRVPKNRKER